MGTNYYAHVKPCPHCKKPDKRLHIGKDSAGWTFSFHAVTASESPDERLIDSWKRWQEVLSHPDVLIVNEYDEAFHWLNFYELVERKKTEPNNHHFYSKHKYGGDDSFTDDEGNSFSWGEFS